MSQAAILIFLAVATLALSTSAVYAANNGIFTLFQFVRDVLDHIKIFLFTPEDTFNVSAINSAIDEAGPRVFVEHKSFFSPSIGTEKNYTVLLPSGYYENSQRRYPVLYLLHGLWGNENTWIVRGRIVQIYQRLLAENKIKEVIIAMPDGDNSAYENDCSGSVAFSCGNYGDYIIKDFIREIDSKYRTMADRNHRAISGLSLGARGAIRLSFLHPDKFVFTGAQSGRYFYLLQEMADEQWTRLKNANITIYFDHSSNDVIPGYFSSSRELNKILTEKGITHEYQELNFPIQDSHGWPFWQQQVVIVLEKACKVICLS
ncbi:MAG: hypothetical protein HY514_04065 [Candidatus Aenigmarchaeota archaeon]|nr:hypothetical protein [Candidatus Aenigmarchaeota archaeon]